MTFAVSFLAVAILTLALVIHLGAQTIHAAITALKEAVDAFKEALKPIAKALGCVAAAVALLAAYNFVRIPFIQAVLAFGALLAALAGVHHVAGQATIALCGFFKTMLVKLDKQFWKYEEFLILAEWWQLGLIAVGYFSITVGALDIAYQIIVVGHHHIGRVGEFSVVLLMIPAIVGMQAFANMLQHVVWAITDWWKERRAA